MEKSAGKEDPVELDSNLALFGDMPRCSISGRRGSRRAASRPSVSSPTLKYHYSHRFPTYSVKRNARFRPRVRPAFGRAVPQSLVASDPTGSGRRVGCAVRARPSACARPCRAAVDIPVALSASRGHRASNRGAVARAATRPVGTGRSFGRPSVRRPRARRVRGPGPWRDPYSEDTARWGV